MKESQPELLTINIIIHFMKKLILAALAIAALSVTAMAQDNDFNYSVDRFADIEVLRYQVPGFEDLSLQQKELVYYLTEAALNGRDILFDQNGKYNLMVRQTLEEIYRNYNGNKTDKDYLAFEKYLKQSSESAPFGACLQ